MNVLQIILKKQALWYVMYKKDAGLLSHLRSLVRISFVDGCLAITISKQEIITVTMLLFLCVGEQVCSVRIIILLLSYSHC